VRITTIAIYFGNDGFVMTVVALFVINLLFDLLSLLCAIYGYSPHQSVRNDNIFKKEHWI